MPYNPQLPGGSGKLNEDKVKRIKRLLKEEPELSITAIAERFGIAQTTISHIKSGKIGSDIGV